MSTVVSRVSSSLYFQVIWGQTWQIKEALSARGLRLVSAEETWWDCAAKITKCQKRETHTSIMLSTTTSASSRPLGHASCLRTFTYTNTQKTNKTANDFFMHMTLYGEKKQTKQS